MAVTGELSDEARIQQAVRGTDAVIGALGPLLRRGSLGTPVTDGTKNIVAAMQTEHVGRYIGLATPSVPDARDKPTLKPRSCRSLPGNRKVLCARAFWVATRWDL